MADRADDPSPGDDAAVADAPKPGKRKLILAAAVLVPTLLGAGVAVSQHETMRGLLGVGDAPAEAEPDETAAPVEYGAFSEIHGLIVNPAGSQGQRYLMVNVGFESQQEKALEALTAKEVAVRDAVLDILSKKTVDQLAAIGFRDSLKTEIRDTVNVILGPDQIDRLYFTQYVLQ